MKLDCMMCGACCIAYSISSLDKEAGTPCPHLQPDGKCGDYEHRPAVCRSFKPDELCLMISALPLWEKVKIIQEVYK